MNVSIRNTIFIGAIALAVAATFNNCSGVNFSSVGNEGVLNNPSPGPSGQPSPNPSNPTQVILNPYINAVAYEDLYFAPGTTPSEMPDYDYNDFLTNFRVQEVTNTSNQVTDIYIDFYPRAVGAGYDHIFYLVLTGTKTTPSNNSNILPTTKAMFQGAATVTLTYYDSNGDVYGTPSNPPYNQDIEVFSSTHAIFGGKPDKNGNYSQIDTTLPSGYTSGVPSNYAPALYNARVHIQLTSPALNPAPKNFDASTLRMILHPIPTNYDIDIINVDPNNFVAGTGNPWGFIIPTEWQWMQESVDIIKGYPTISSYQEYLAGQNPSCATTDNCINWFNYPVTGTTAASTLYPIIPFQPTNPVLK
jgi:hypothetical protein